MTMTALRNAVFNRLQTIPDAPSIVLPNAGAAPTTPRIEVQIGPMTNATATLLGDTEHTADIVLTVAIASGERILIADEIVEKIAALFPAGLRIGGAVITQMPETRPPLIGDGEYRVPVFVTYRAMI